MSASAASTTSDALAGFAYADGVFETMRSHRGEIPLWPRHRLRLTDSLSRLGLDPPHWAELEQRLQSLACANPESVIKLIGFSADSGRGYLRLSSRAELRLQVHPLPPVRDQMRARTADLRLAGGGDLAGMKSLARIEQRIAATAVAQQSADVALLRNRNGLAVSFSHGNLVLDYGGRLRTAPLSHGAIAGVVRGLLLEHQPLPISVQAIPYSWLFEADAVLLTNAVRGVQSVSHLDSQVLRTGSAGTRLQQWLARRGLAPIARVESRQIHADD